MFHTYILFNECSSQSLNECWHGPYGFFIHSSSLSISREEAYTCGTWFSSNLVFRPNLQKPFLPEVRGGYIPLGHGFSFTLVFCPSAEKHPSIHPSTCGTWFSSNLVFHPNLQMPSTREIIVLFFRFILFFENFKISKIFSKYSELFCFFFLKIFSAPENTPRQQIRLKSGR